MSDVIFYIMLFVFASYSIITIKHDVHMLQQNSYRISRYARWFMAHKKRGVSIKVLVLLFALPVIYLGFDWLAYLSSALYLACLIAFYDKQKEKKALVYTNRVKRIYVTWSLLMLVFILVMISSYFAGMISKEISFFIMVILSTFSQLLVLLASFINEPIERMIGYRYILDAKKKISKMNDLKVIGITGSYGKTSTKYILSYILERHFNVLKTPKSYNTTMGVVRTIREQLKPIHEVFVVEMGAKQKGDIKEICDIVNPQYGVITSIGNQHLETFKTLDNIRNTKLELFSSLPSFGTAYVNKDDKEILKGTNNEDKQYIYYSMETEDCEYYLYKSEMNMNGMTFHIRGPKKEEYKFQTQLLGKHQLMNILACVAIAHSLGISFEAISRAVMMLEPVEHRLQIRKVQKDLIYIDDAFNSNEHGSKEALNVLGSFEGFYKVLITPGMIELGDLQDEINCKFGIKAATIADLVILVGKNQTEPIYRGINKKNAKEKCIVVDYLDEALKILNEIKERPCVVLFENDLPDLFV